MNYRDRFRKYFTIIGSSQGESLVADRRNHKEDWNENLGSSRIAHGDQITNLGDYIAMLAMEYKILNDNGQNTEQTGKELYYALYAFNRLDLAAEPYFGKDPSLNGFFIRNDIPPDFINTHPDINLGLDCSQPNYIVGSGEPQCVYSTESGIPAGFTFPDDCNCECETEDCQKCYNSAYVNSPDQIAGLYFGMAMVVKCVPFSAHYNGLTFQDGKMFFVSEARSITDRVTMWMKNNNWKINSPTDCKLWGEPSWMRYAFGVAAGEIMGDPDKYKDITFDGIDWCAIKYGWNNCNNFLSEWEFCDIEYNAKIVMLLAAIGNSWECIFDNKSTYHSILDIASNYNNWELFYPLIYTILHGGDNLTIAGLVENLLSSAPENGPYNHAPGNANDFDPNGWCTPFLFRADNNEQIAGGINRGNFHGLDFMLLHNMYMLLWKIPSDPDCDAVPDLLITALGPAPSNINYFPNTTIAAKEEIITTGAVIPPFGQTWRAGISITLNPGFETIGPWTGEIGGCIDLNSRLANYES